VKPTKLVATVLGKVLRTANANQKSCVFAWLAETFSMERVPHIIGA